MQGDVESDDLPRLPPNWRDTASLEKHPELHHYTTEAGLRGIVTTNTLWATHFGDLNDASEMTFVQEPLERELAVRFREYIRARRAKSERINRAVAALGGLHKAAEDNAKHMVGLLYASTFMKSDRYEGVSDLRAPAFVTSFCTHTEEPYERENGLLSQWRGYGGSGGYCIVFDTQKMFWMLDAEISAASYMSTAIDKVQYLDPAGSVSEVFPAVIAKCEEMIQFLLLNRRGEPEDIFSDFTLAAMFCKHHGFHEERELRIAMRPATEGWRQVMAAERKWRVPPSRRIEGGDGSKRRITLFEGLERKLPIKRVIVGPAIDQSERERAAIELLGGDVPVHRSATPYVERDWGRAS